MEDAKSLDDALSRRLKNRERQRRYRAKKRLQADSTNGATTLQHTQPFLAIQKAQEAEAQKQLTCTLPHTVSRIYCKRDWKKDARLAHTSKRPSLVACSSNSSIISSYESEAPQLLLQLRGESSFGSDFHLKNPSVQDVDETKTSTPIRRDWKAAARSKTN